ncbi:MAG: hypothetical protein AB1486_05420 [Planctomycetota bacterium]
MKAESDELEALYATNDLAREFDPLLSLHDWQERERLAAAKAADLATFRSQEELLSFLDRAVRFLGDEHRLSRLYGVAWNLGGHAPASETVQCFVRSLLARPAVSPRTECATVAAASWVATLRRCNSPDSAEALVRELMAICGGEEQQVNFIVRVYPGPPQRRDAGEFTPSERDHLRSLAPLFLRNARGPEFIGAVAWTLRDDWPTLELLLERTLDSIPREQVELAISVLVNVVGWTVDKRDPGGNLSGLAPWLLDQLLRLPDIDRLASNADWRVEEILNRIGRAPLSWLPEALKKRRDMEARAGDEEVRAVSWHPSLSRYVTQVSSAQINDPEITQAVEALIDLVLDRGTVGYHMPEILRDVDPHGLVVPGEVAQRLSRAADAEEVWGLDRIAGAYPLGGPAWRTIARPVVVCAAHLGNEEERRSLFTALTDHGPRSWSRLPGEVPEVFVSAVQSARALLESETDAELRPFWQWYLELTEAELRGQEERAKEE